jgi:hypothetical protein
MRMLLAINYDVKNSNYNDMSDNNTNVLIL